MGKPKFEYEKYEINPDMYNTIVSTYKEKMTIAVQEVDKTIRDENLDKLTKEVENYYAENNGEQEAELLPETKKMIAQCLYNLEKVTVRELIYNEHKRVDGRKLEQIRPLSCEIGLIPRVHGSALFTRGQTQVLSVATLGMISEEQMLDGLDLEESKRYMHHYNFPAYSVGEARASRGPGRREVGHGALAEKALIPVLPTEEEFPYAIRVVSEILSSNGSTSQGSICRKYFGINGRRSSN